MLSISPLKQRIMTATILVCMMVGVLWYASPLIFTVLLGLVTLVAAYEWSLLIGLITRPARISYMIIVWLVFVGLVYATRHLSVYLEFCIYFFYSGILVWWLFATALVICYPRYSRWWARSIFWRGIMGVLVLASTGVALSTLRYCSWCFSRSPDAEHTELILYLFVLIWVADSVAYFVGRKWGKTKLAPHVSPGKSIEGLCGAMLVSIPVILCGLRLLRLPGYPSYPWPWMILSIVTVLASVVGDLFESMLKREAGVKDSGQLLPGHGGLLDRIDSLTAAAPVFMFGILLIWYFEPSL